MSKQDCRIEFLVSGALRYTDLKTGVVVIRHPNGEFEGDDCLTPEESERLHVVLDAGMKEIARLKQGLLN